MGEEEINAGEEAIDCEICNPKNFYKEADDLKDRSLDWSEEKRLAFYDKPMTILEFMQHEVTHEYEKAKRAILGKDMVTPAKVIKDKNDDNMT